MLDEDNDIYYSPINLWEISIKYALKKLDLRGMTPEELYEEIENSYFLCKELINADVITNYKVPRYHKDPFDRFLIWEAIRNDLTLLSNDGVMEYYKKAGLKTIY